jgi:hypothetical protein
MPQITFQADLTKQTEGETSVVTSGKDGRSYFNSCRFDRNKDTLEAGNH